jgi:hypothetical protein
MSTVPFVSSIRLVPELLTVPTRIRLPVNHQTRMTENALEFTALVPTDIDEAERERVDFLYSVIEAGQEPLPIKDFQMEVSGFAANEWLRSLDPLHMPVRELAYVKYTPRFTAGAVKTPAASPAMQPA